ILRGDEDGPRSAGPFSPERRELLTTFGFFPTAGFNTPGHGGDFASSPAAASREKSREHPADSWQDARICWVGVRLWGTIRSCSCPRAGGFQGATRRGSVAPWRHSEPELSKNWGRLAANLSGLADSISDIGCGRRAPCGPAPATARGSAARGST